MYVSKDGQKEFSTIGEALEAAAEYDGSKVVLHISPGIYRERLVINQNNVSFIGEDEGTTKITWSDAALDVMPDGDKRGTFRTPSVFIDADDFYACHISFMNEAGQGYEVGQALAVYADGDRLSFENCRFEGYQDTLFTAQLPKKEKQPGGFKGPKEFAPRRHGRHLYKDCFISGNIDFIFGSATAYFEGCEIFMRNRNDMLSGYVTAPSTYEGEEFGYVFNHCRFTSDCPRESAYLGRPWRDFAKAVILNSEIGAHIKKEGWHDWDKKNAWDTMFFAEYGNFGEGASKERAPFVKMLSAQEAAKYTRENVLGFKNGGFMRTISIKTYYSSLPNMLSKFDRYARRDAFLGNTLEEFQKWQTKARRTLWELLGLDKMDKVELMPRTEETVTLEDAENRGIVRQRVLIQSEQDVWIPMYILTPPRNSGQGMKKNRVFIAPPGHQGAGKYSVAGVSEIPAVADAIKKFNYDYGLQLARQGFTVICPDCRGFGERRDEKKQGDKEADFLTSSCFHLAHMAEAIGETVAGMCAWDLMKIMDFIEEQADAMGWDAKNVSCLGFSGGGMQTLYFAALDERVKNAFISGYMYGCKESLMLLNGNCSCNYVPHLWERFDMGDIASLIAPRNLMIQSCRGDHLNGPRGLENVYEQVDIIRAAYRLSGHEDRVVHDVCEGGHRWHDEHLGDIMQGFGITRFAD